MKIEVRFFASLRERVGKEQLSLDLPAPATVADAWAAATGGMERPPNTLAAVNMDYVDFDAAVKEGDEVAFFPPVTGG